MLPSGPACTLRIYIGESETCGHEPLFEAIVTKAREVGLAGATLIRGSMGFGASHRMHTTKVLRLSADLPMVIEIIDRRDKIDAFLPYLEQVMEGGFATVAMVEVAVVGEEKGSA